MLPKYDVSIDKLVIVGDDTGRFSETVSDPYNEHIEKMTGAAFPYRKSWHCVDGSFIQWSDHDKMKPIRVEFNPSKCDGEGIERILRSMKYPKVNRVDIAYDFRDIDLSTYKFIDLISRKRNYWENGSGRLETLYIGSPNSDLRIRIYDKAKEQGVEGDWWRIEAQLRGDFCKSINGDLGVEGLTLPPFLPDYFQHIKIFIPSLEDLKDIKVQEKAMIHYLLTDSSRFAELSNNSKKKYKKILATLQSNEDLELSDLFAHTRADNMYHIQKWLDISRKNNVIASIP
jgi:hypothetical protein